MKTLSPLIIILALSAVLFGCTQNSSKQPPAPRAQLSSQTTTISESPSSAFESKIQREPVYAEQLADGVYEISVDSSSSMFRVVKCVLTVANGEMTAAMTMSGQGYGMVFMGTGEQALKADKSEYIPFELDEDGAKLFTVPVKALNQEVDCAAWSIKKEKWYDRVLVFESDMIPAQAIIERR